MRWRKIKKNKKSTIKFGLFVVLFIIVFNSLILFFSYSKNMSKSSVILIQEKLDKIIYQFFSDLINEDVYNVNSTSNIMVINKNSLGEIVNVDYNLEKTYKLLSDTSNILKDALSNLENGKIDVKVYDKYLENSENGLVFNIPIFLSSKNILLNNIGPRIPVLINFNNSLLTNIKTKVTDYGFNNALLEVYITVEIDKLIITPLYKDEDKFFYDILIGATVVNGSVPKFYGMEYEKNSNAFNVPLS